MGRNIAILTVSQALMMSSSITIALLGGIIGTQIAPDPAWSTLPLSMMMVGLGLGTIPAALIMRRIGRRRGFVGSALTAAAAALLAASGVAVASFTLFCLAVLLIGACLAFTQQYRFAAAESVAPHRVARAISVVLLGSLAGAYLGPEVAKRAQGAVFDALYAGPFLGLAVMALLAAVLLSRLREVGAPREESRSEGRPLRVVMSQPKALVAVMAGVVSYVVMNFIMTATPISMHVHHGFSLAQTVSVVQSHVIAMYAPSLVSGAVIHRLGGPRVMTLGVVSMVACVAAATLGQGFANYWTALVLLGVGWNFLFVGGTTLLTQAYRPSERFRVQALNDFSIFGLTALGSLLAGAVVHNAGWVVLNLLTLAPLAAMLLALGWLVYAQRIAQASDVSAES